MGWVSREPRNAEMGVVCEEAGGGGGGGGGLGLLKINPTASTSGLRAIRDGPDASLHWCRLLAGDMHAFL